MASKAFNFTKKTIKDIDLQGKRVLLRADFNVPMSEDGIISSSYRITETLPTLQYLLERDCEIVLISHLGRPDGKRDLRYTLQPVAEKLEELLGRPVHFLSGGLDDASHQSLKKFQSRKISLLENIRFYPGEEANDPAFAKKLKDITGPDYFVQDCFGVAHRAHASIEGICHLVPAVAGLLLEKEVITLMSAMEDPARPLVAVLGGAKISDKLPLVERFVEKADHILIGGAMANTFLSAEGYAVGKSLVDKDGLRSAKDILSGSKKDQIVLPKDVAVSDEISATGGRRDTDLTDVGSGEAILDIGPKTMQEFSEILERAGTVVWNGPMGYSENPAFAKGSEVLAETLANNPDITSIIGGGDTADALLEWVEKNPGKKFTHISTGGGASLELMSGQKLPGVEALLDK